MPEAKSYSHRLESVRGLAALAVAGFHVLQSEYQLASGARGRLLDGGANPGAWSGFARLTDTIFNGPGAVIAFFVLSGFVLSLSLERMQGSATARAAVFLARRVTRLLPPVAFMLATTAAVYFSTGLLLNPPSAGAFTVKGLLLDTQINGVVWSLQVEAFAAPLILLTWLLTQRYGLRVLWIALALTIVTRYSSTLDKGLWAIGFPAFRFTGLLGAFVAGMFLPAWIAYARRTGLATRLGPWYPIAGIVLIMGAAPFFGPASRYRFFGEAWGTFMLIGGIRLHMNKLLGRFLDWAPVRFYGRISFSFYLLHPLAVAIFWAQPQTLGLLVDRGIPGVVVGLVATVLSLAIATPLAALAYHLVEKPSVRLGHRIGAATAPSARSPGAGQTPAAMNTLQPAGA